MASNLLILAKFKQYFPIRSLIESWMVSLLLLRICTGLSSHLLLIVHVDVLVSLSDDLALDAFHPSFEVCDIGLRHRMHHELNLARLHLLRYLVRLARVQHIDAGREV